MSLPANFSDWPFITCLCPTYCRPVMLQTAVECWRRQDYPRQRIALLVMDDSPRHGLVNSKWFAGFRNAALESYPGFSTLPHKYNYLAHRALARWPQTDLFVVWEDDDLYLPQHCQAIAAAWEADSRRAAWWSHPKHVWSDYPMTEHDGGALGGSIVREAAAGRFHAALAISRGAWQLRSWVETPRADFDQQYLGILGQSLGAPADPLPYAPSENPTYVFRWHTGHAHGQSAMRSPDDCDWLAKARLLTASRPSLAVEAEQFSPQLDTRAQQIWHSFPFRAPTVPTSAGA